MEIRTKRQEQLFFKLTCETFEECKGAYIGFASAYNLYIKEVSTYRTLLEAMATSEKLVNTALIEIFNQDSFRLLTDPTIAKIVEIWENNAKDSTELHKMVSDFLRQ